MVFSQESLESAAKEQLLTRFGNLALDFSEGCHRNGVETGISGLHRLKISAVGHEYSDLFALTKSEHEGSQKVILVFVSLCQELVSLTEEARSDFLFQLLLFGEGQDESEDSENNTNELVSSFLLVLLKLQAYLRRCRVVIEQVAKQIESFHTCTNLGLESKGVHLKPVFEKLSELLSTLATLDIACENNEALRNGVDCFEKSLRTANHDPDQFGVTREDLGHLAAVVRTLKKELLSGDLFQNAIRIAIASNVVVSEIMTNIKGRMSDLESRTPKDDPAVDTQEVMRIVCLYSLSFQLGNVVEKKSATQLWDTRKKILAVPVPCNNLWLVTRHLLKHIPGIEKIFDSKQVKSAENDVLSFIQQKDADVVKELPVWEAKVSAWNSKFEEACTIVNPSVDELRQLTDIIQTGMKTASSLRHTAELVLSLHTHFVPAMSKGLVLAVFRYVELADWTIRCLRKKCLSIVKTLSTSLEHLAYSALSILFQIQKRVQDEKKHKDRQQVFSALISMACRSLNGPITEERRLIARISLACACGTSASALTSEERSAVGDLLKKLELNATFQDKLKQVDDFSFLFWNRTMLPVCLNDFYAKKKNIASLNVIVNRFSDIIHHCDNSDSNDSKVRTSLLKEITDNVVSIVLDPLCRDVELELRLSTHTHLGGTEKPVFKEGAVDFNAVLNAGPVRIGDKIISVSEYVTNYLDRTFYNLTSVASHDWKTYMEMRVLAKKRFQLYTLDDRLPIQRLEQGLDVLEIIRNINVFATHYVYDLYSQSFIERQSDGKFLTTISIRHIANSIRTHGSGIISSAVNHTYQFLRQKFHIFSQFLYDDQIKSRLIKDLKMTRELRSQAAGEEASQKFVVVYPYEKAEKFVRGIKNLGVTVDGRSYLDEYRLLITEVGNVMGYVRMLRSGNLHCCASTSDVLPSLAQPLTTLNSVMADCNFSEETVDAAVELERVLQNVTKNFEGGSDFLKLLVQAFAPAFRDQKHSHLKLFYLIIPPLTVSFVDNIRNGKERLQRKDKQNSFFTDDGFVMGLAYILALLDQGNEFDSLHWFETVSQRYTNALVDIRHQQAIGMRGSGKKGEDGEKLKQTLNLTIRRLEACRQEFELLEYSLVSARALFRSSLSNIPFTEKDDSKSIGTSPSVCGESNSSA